MTDDQLRLRPIVITGGTAPDDYQVFWRDLPIGRILKQPGVPMGRPGSLQPSPTAQQSN